MSDMATAPEIPPSHPTRSIPFRLMTDAGLMVATFAALLVLRWKIQHHSLNADDAQFFWLFTPLFVAMNWWRYTRGSRRRG